MADRQVTQSGKDRDGDITALCNPNGSWSRGFWPARSTTTSHSYYVILSGGQRANLVVVKGQTGKYLRTDRDSTTRNNLDELPDC